MKPYSVRIFSFVSLVLFLFACQKHINDVLLPTPVPEPGPKDSLSLSAETVITNLHGKVLDDAGSPLKDAVVSAGGTTTSTDEYGIFSLRNVTVSKQFGYISVKKNGFFDGSRTVLTNPTTGNFVEIQLIKKDLKGSFNAAEQASLQIDPNTTINFQQQAIVDENGQVYNGIVKVYGAVINPSDNNFSRTMPGDLRGLRNDSTVTALISYGMITVNLEGESGQKLQLAPTKSATISHVISDELIANAPPTIPMWHFDETDGIWKEEGNAVKKGNTYEGEVAHFSTWNFDDPAQSVVISVKVIYENSMPVPYTRVQISESNGYLSNTGFTDSTGYLSIWAIKGVPLKLLIVDPASNTLFSKNIGTVTGNLDLGEIVIGLENAHVKIKGEVINCEESFVNNGTVTLKVENLYYSTNIVSGQFELPLPIDPGSGIGAQLFLNDIDGAISDVKNINVVAGVNNIGVVKLCNDVPVIIPDSLDEYVVYTLGSDTTEYNPTVDSFFFDGSSSPKSWLYVAKNAMAGGESLQFDWNKTNYGIRFELMRDVPSTYMDNGMNLIQMKHNGMLFTSDDSTVYTVVQYGGLGEPIEFNYSGNLKDSIGNRIPIAGAFKITRR